MPLFSFCALLKTPGVLFSWDVERDRRNHQRCSIKKAVLKDFAIFTGKHLCWRLKDSNATILKNICEQLLLKKPVAWNRLTLEALTTRTDQTYWKNSSTKADELFECVWPFCRASAERVNIYSYTPWRS